MRNRTYLTLSVLLLLTALTGCTLSQTDTPAATATLGLPPFTQTPSPPSATPAIAGASPITTPAPGETPVSAPPADVNIPSLSAVILLPPGEELNIRAAAGTGNRVVGTFSATAANVLRTGPTSRIGEDLWAEVNLPGGGAGWVNTRYLTEYVPATTFCADSHIQLLLDELEVALQTADGDLMASLVSQTHGLDLRYWRYGTLANYTPAEAAWAFKSDYIVNWGNEPGSGLEKSGTFSEIPLPKLLEVFTANYELHCNDASKVSAFAIQPWPEEYANINYYLVYKPGVNPDYGGLDWRAWAVGIEYAGGKPYLFALIHFEWEP